MHVIAMAIDMNNVSHDNPAKYTGICNLWNYNHGNSLNK